MVISLRGAGCVFAEEEAALLIEAASSPVELARMLGERVAGTPLEQVLGWAEFGGLRIVVEPGVFVPRRRTELLARTAASFARAGSVVVDLCCGSGAVGAWVRSTVPDAQVFATDLDPVAVRCARRNLSPEQVLEGDLFAALPDDLRRKVDVVACNAPYVPTAEIAMMPPEARDHERRVALDGGADGLEVQRRVVDGASAWLAPGGVLLVETSVAQSAYTAGLFQAAGLGVTVEHDPDRAGTVVVGVSGAAGPAPARNAGR